MPRLKTIRGARNIATAPVPRIAGLRLFSNAWPMSAELVGSAHKIVHISQRVVLDDAILIDKAGAQFFAEQAPGMAWRQ
jgi:hypothetical protein